VDSRWSNDKKALDGRTRERFPSLEATRTALSARSKETQMRYFKSHPALAAIVALLALSLVGGVAYAVVREVFVTVDPQKPADEIQKDVQTQLQAAGVNATVQADKNDEGRLKIRIGTTDPHVGSDLKVTIKGMPAGEQQQLRLELKVTCELDDAQKEALTAAAGSEAIHKLVLERGDATDADIAAAVQKILADAGFTDTEVAVAEGSLSITIKSPPPK
jgi:hypothetical protein